MSQVIINIWSAEDGEMTEDVIRARYANSGAHRVATYSYPPGSSVQAKGMPGKCFLLRGRFRFRFDAAIDDVVLSAGTWAEVPGGYRLEEVVSSDDAKMVWVWHLESPRAQA